MKIRRHNQNSGGLARRLYRCEKWCINLGISPPPPQYKTFHVESIFFESAGAASLLVFFIKVKILFLPKPLAHLPHFTNQNPVKKSIGIFKGPRRLGELGNALRRRSRTLFLHLAVGYWGNKQTCMHGHIFCQAPGQYQWWIQLICFIFGAEVRWQWEGKNIFIQFCYLISIRDMTLRWALDLMKVSSRPHPWYSWRHNLVGGWFGSCIFISAAAKQRI